MEIAWGKIAIILGMIAFVTAIVLMQKLGKKKQKAVTALGAQAHGTEPEPGEQPPKPASAAGERRKVA